MDIKFTRCGARPDGELLYRMEIDGRTAAEGLTLDQVIEAINKGDEERLGEEHGTGKADCHASAASPARNDGRRVLEIININAAQIRKILEGEDNGA